MKKLLTLAVALVAAALVTTGHSTAQAACTNHVQGFVFTSTECTNKPGFLLVDCPKGCTNKFSLNLADCPKGCTNKVNLAECTKGGCTNKFSLSFALGTLECTNKPSGLKI